MPAPDRGAFESTDRAAGSITGMLRKTQPGAAALPQLQRGANEVRTESKNSKYPFVERVGDEVHSLCLRSLFV